MTHPGKCTKRREEPDSAVFVVGSLEGQNHVAATTWSFYNGGWEEDKRLTYIIRKGDGQAV